MSTVEFHVPGKPVPWERAGKSGKRHFTKPATRAYQASVRMLASAAMRSAQPWECPVVLTVEVILEPPKSWSGRRKAEAIAGRIVPSRKPDLDNYLKTVSDALNGSVFHDDAQVVSLVGSKRFGRSAGLTVRVTADSRGRAP